MDASYFNPSIYNDCSVLWIHIYIYTFSRLSFTEYRLINIILHRSQIGTYNGVRLKMLNAYLNNAEYKHLTYIHLISRNFYSSSKGRFRRSMRRHFRAELLRYYIAAWYTERQKLTLEF